MGKKFSGPELIDFLMDQFEKPSQENVVQLFVDEDENTLFSRSTISRMASGKTKLKQEIIPNLDNIAENILYQVQDYHRSESYSELVTTWENQFKENGFDETLGLFSRFDDREIDDKEWEYKLISFFVDLIRVAYENSNLEASQNVHQDYVVADNFSSHDREIIGRQTELKKMDELLFDEHKTSITLTGIGGIGKSALAINFVEDRRDKIPGFIRYYEYDQTEDFKTNIANKLLPDYPFSTHDEEKRFKEVVSALHSQKNGGLVVIDNMNGHPKAATGYKELTAGGNVQFIFVTREASMPDDDNSVYVGELSTEDQVRLFNQYYDGDKVNQDTLEEILHRIGGHTMMIELLAKYAETTYDSLDHVLAMLKQKGIEALDSPVDTIHGYAFHKQETIQETVKWLFDVSELSDTEKRLLSLLAQLPTAGFKAPDFNKATNNVFRADLNELKNRSWIHIEHWMISVHPLIREAVNDYHLLKFNDVIGLATFVKEKLQGDITLSEVNDYASMVANLVRNVEYDDNDGWGEFDEIADLLADKHAYGTLPSIYTELIKKRPDDDNYLRIVDAYKRVGKFAEAIKMDQEYITFASSPSQYAQRADADTEIGNLYRKQGDYENAKKYFEDALQEFEGKPTDSLIYADIYNQRGIMYVNLDRLDEAEADYIKSLKIRKASKADEPEKTEQIAYSNHNLGTVFQKRFEKNGQLEDLNRAISFHTTALQLRNDRVDCQLDQIGQSYTQLGRDYALKKDWKNAEANLKRGLEVRIEQYGDIENNEIAWANFGLGEMYHNAGDNQTALIYAKKAYDIRNDAADVDKNFQYIVESGVLLVKIYSALGRAKEANDMVQLVEEANKQVKNKEKANSNLEKLQEAMEIE